MQKVHGHFTFIKLPLDESNRFHYLFKTPFGSFHHFPHGTCSLSNYNLGLGEQLMFPEVDFDKIIKLQGMDICIVTTSMINS